MIYILVKNVFVKKLLWEYQNESRLRLQQISSKYYISCYILGYNMITRIKDFWQTGFQILQPKNLVK